MCIRDSNRFSDSSTNIERAISENLSALLWTSRVSRLARDNLACSIEVACSHVSGLLMQPKPTAGPDGVCEPRPHNSNGINLPPKRQASLSCVGSTDCAITRHCSLASSRAWLGSLGRRGHALVILLPVRVCAVQLILAETETIVAHRDGCSCS